MYLHWKFSIWEVPSRNFVLADKAVMTGHSASQYCISIPSAMTSSRSWLQFARWELLTQPTWVRTWQIMHQTKVGLSLGRSYFRAFLLPRSWLRVLRFCDLQSSQRQSEEIFVTFMACFMMVYQRTNTFLLFSSPLCSNLIILGRAIIEAHVAKMEERGDDKYDFF